MKSSIVFPFLTTLLLACGGPGFAAPIPPSDDDGLGNVSADADADMDSSPNSESSTDTITDESDAVTADTAVDAVDTGRDTGPTCSTPTTPLLNNIQGAPGAGIEFRVTRNTTLKSFIFTGGGHQDTITLYDDSCNAITSASVPGVSPPVYAAYTVNVQWPLKAGTLYKLTNSFQNQTAFEVPGPAFPYTDGELVVTKGTVTCPDQGFGATNWSAFTDLTFCD